MNPHPVFFCLSGLNTLLDWNNKSGAHFPGDHWANPENTCVNVMGSLYVAQLALQSAELSTERFCLNDILCRRQVRLHLLVHVRPLRNRISCKARFFCPLFASRGRGRASAFQGLASWPLSKTVAQTRAAFHRGDTKRSPILMHIHAIYMRYIST